MSRTHRLYDPHWTVLPRRLDADLAAALRLPHPHIDCDWSCGTPYGGSRRADRSPIVAELARRGWRPRRARRVAMRMGRFYTDLPDRQIKLLHKRAARHRAKQLIGLERYDELIDEPRSCCACGW